MELPLQFSTINQEEDEEMRKKKKKKRGRMKKKKKTSSPYLQIINPSLQLVASKDPRWCGSSGSILIVDISITPGMVLSQTTVPCHRLYGRQKYCYIENGA